MDRESPSTDAEPSPARERMSLGLTLHLPQDEQGLLSTAWFEDIRLARALLAGTFWVRGLPTHPQHLPAEDAPPHAAFRALDGLMAAAARGRVNVVVQIGDADSPANLQAVGTICRRLKGQVEAYVLSAGDSADAGQLHTLLSLAHLARRTDPAASVGLHGVADALIELHHRAEAELEPIDFLALHPRVLTDHRGWDGSAATALAGQVEHAAVVGKPVWIGPLCPSGEEAWSSLGTHWRGELDVKHLVRGASSAGAERLCLEAYRGAAAGALVRSNGAMSSAADAFIKWHRWEAPCWVEVKPLRLRSALPAEVGVAVFSLGETPRRGRLRLEYAGKVGEQSLVSVEPDRPLELTLTLHPEHLAEGANLVFARFAVEGEAAGEVYGFNQVVRPMPLRLRRSTSDTSAAYLPNVGEVSAFLEHSGGDLAIVVGSAGVGSRLAGRLIDRIERMTGRTVPARLATAAGDVMDRPLILLTVGEDNALARIAQQGLKRGRITGRSPAAGRGRIIHIQSPFGESAEDPRCAQVGLYYDTVPEALIVGGSDEAGLTAAVNDLLDRLQPEKQTDA